MTVVSSGTSSMKHLRSVSAMWKYKPNTVLQQASRATNASNCFDMFYLIFQKLFFNQFIIVFALNPYFVNSTRHEKKFHTTQNAKLTAE